MSEIPLLLSAALLVGVSLIILILIEVCGNLGNMH